MRPKISHFWSPNFRASRFGAKKRGEGEEQEEKRRRRGVQGRFKGMESLVWNLYGILKFCMDFHEIVWISMEL